MTRIAGLALVLALAPVVPASTAQDQRVEWENAEEVGDKDRAAILRLAQRLGIDEPRRVEFTTMTSCPYVLVESAVATEGKRHARHDH